MHQEEEKIMPCYIPEKYNYMYWSCGREIYIYIYIYIKH